MLNEINWPHEYLPGTTDNFASNEVILKGVSAKEAFENLIDTAIWPTYYDNVSDVEFDNTKGTKLEANTRFRFKTFGFPIEAEITEFIAPNGGQPGRLSWHGWAEGDAEHRLDVIHAWLLEEVSENRLRILTQESQIGKPAAALHEDPSDPMNVGHQNWLRGLAKTLLEAKKTR